MLENNPSASTSTQYTHSTVYNRNIYIYALDLNLLRFENFIFLVHIHLCISSQVLHAWHIFQSFLKTQAYSILSVQEQTLEFDMVSVHWKRRAFIHQVKSVLHSLKVSEVESV